MALQEKADPHEIWPVQVCFKTVRGELKNAQNAGRTISDHGLQNSALYDFSPEQIPTD